jgi:hypothetical protein
VADDEEDGSVMEQDPTYEPPSEEVEEEDNDGDGGGGLKGQGMFIV